MGMGHGPKAAESPAPSPGISGQTFKRLMGYLTDTARAKIRLIIVFVVICSSGANAAGTYLLTPAINGDHPLIGATITAESIAPFVRTVVLMRDYLPIAAQLRRTYIISS